MGKKAEAESSIESSRATQEFVKKNWPAALLITGTVVGAAVWMTARYLRKRKERDQQVDKNLEQIEQEAGLAIHPNIMLLENGSLLAHVAGQEVEVATNELGVHMDHQAGRDAIETLGQIAANEHKK